MAYKKRHLVIKKDIEKKMCTYLEHYNDINDHLLYRLSPIVSSMHELDATRFVHCKQISTIVDKLQQKDLPLSENVRLMESFEPLLTNLISLAYKKKNLMKDLFGKISRYSVQLDSYFKDASVGLDSFSGQLSTALSNTENNECVASSNNKRKNCTTVEKSTSTNLNLNKEDNSSEDESEMLTNKQLLINGLPGGSGTALWRVPRYGYFSEDYDSYLDELILSRNNHKEETITDKSSSSIDTELAKTIKSTTTTELDSKSSKVSTTTLPLQIASKVEPIGDHVNQSLASQPTVVSCSKKNPKRKSGRKCPIKKKEPPITKQTNTKENSSSNNNSESCSKRTRPLTVQSSGVKKVKQRNERKNEPLYCICKYTSYGHMVCCDNDLCEIEWFHFPCVKLTSKPKGKWYCPACRGDRSNVPRKLS